MKKILAILLALTLALSVFALVGCNDDGDDDTPKTDPALDAYVTALSATAPETAVVKTTVESVLDLILEGEYNITYSDDGSASVAYVYDKVNTFGEGVLDELVSEVSGTATIAADGTVTGDVSASVAGAATKSFNLDQTKLKTYTAEDSGLIATVEAANASSVLGATIEGLTSDVSLSMFMNNGKITSVSITYSTSAGEVNIECSYN